MDLSWLVIVEVTGPITVERQISKARQDERDLGPNRIRRGTDVCQQVLLQRIYAAICLDFYSYIWFIYSYTGYTSRRRRMVMSVSCVKSFWIHCIVMVMSLCSDVFTLPISGGVGNDFLGFLGHRHRTHCDMASTEAQEAQETQGSLGYSMMIC